MKILITFNSVNFQIFGTPAYFLCAFAGFVVATSVYIVLMYSKRYDISQSMKILMISLFGLVLGAKIFGFLTGIYRNIGTGEKVTLETMLDTGIVFYGGLLGLLIVYMLCLKSKRYCLDKYAVDILAVCIPLFHSIARIGCFLSGCCFGKIYEGVLSINYITIINGNIDENMRFPIQLIEALFEFLLFLYLLNSLNSDRWKKKKLLVRYLIFYSIFRFMFEYLRGDIRRGLIYGISFSQCISVFIWMNLGFLYLRQYIISKRKGGL